MPGEWLADVRAATEDTLFELAEHLPSEAAEALLELATGGRPRRVAELASVSAGAAAGVSEAEGAEDDPFQHPDAQRRFRVMTNVAELERALAYPWEKWTVFLHPSAGADLARGGMKARRSLLVGETGGHGATPTRGCGDGRGKSGRESYNDVQGVHLTPPLERHAMNTANRGITATELVAVLGASVLVLALLVAIFLPALANGGGSPRMQANTQMRGIHQGMVMYAYDNHGYYPGFNAEGEPEALSVEERFRLLLDGDYFAPDYLVSPSERRRPWESGLLTSEHYSFAMLQVPEAGGRYDEWRETLNARAAILADRNTGTANQPDSIHIRGEWRGGVAWNDNHVGFETTHIHDTNYGGVDNRDDHIFRAAGDDDAYLIHSGN